MLPKYLVSESTVRESGEGAVFDFGEPNKDLFLTLGITHAVEQQSIDVEIHGSADGVHWLSKPLASFASKSYCGKYYLTLPAPRARFLKAVWKVRRWSRGNARPYFSFYLVSQSERVRAMAGAA